ncbi:MAG: deoxyribose-phosphate aldolase [bacterium]|nr:deoxyribose-phosphate aldolase [bacterium]
MTTLASQGESRCSGCQGQCVARCPDKVRSVVGAGASRISSGGVGARVPSDLARYIDHTLLKPGATPADVDRLCDEAREHGFVAVCCNPVWVRRAAQRLKGTGVMVASVVGFPLGANAPQTKAWEARRALRDGAREIDMVVSIGALKGGDYELVERDIAGVSDACREVGALNKVIIETALLTDEEKVIAARLAQAGRAHYVKTSTGFGPGGATVYDVALMRETIGSAMGVKASGGIRTADDARQMIAAGATRIGASAGVEMVKA